MARTAQALRANYGPEPHELAREDGRDGRVLSYPGCEPLPEPAYQGRHMALPRESPMSLAQRLVSAREDRKRAEDERDSAKQGLARARKERDDYAQAAHGWRKDAGKYRTVAIVGWTLAGALWLGMILQPILASLPLARWLPNLFGR